MVHIIRRPPEQRGNGDIVHLTVGRACAYIKSRKLMSITRTCASQKLSACLGCRKCPTWGILRQHFPHTLRGRLAWSVQHMRIDWRRACSQAVVGITISSVICASAAQNVVVLPAAAREPSATALMHCCSGLIPMSLLSRLAGRRTQRLAAMQSDISQPTAPAPWPAQQS